MPIEDKQKRTYGKNGRHNVIVLSGEQGEHEHFWYNANTGQMGWHGAEVTPELKRIAGQDAAHNAKPITVRRRERMPAIVTLNLAAAQAHEDYATVYDTAATSLEEDGRGAKDAFRAIQEQLGPYEEDYETLLNQMLEAGNACVELMRAEAQQLRDSAEWIRNPIGTPRPRPRIF